MTSLTYKKIYYIDKKYRCHLIRLKFLLSGYIVDSTGGYTIPFIIMGCGTALCGGLMGIQVFALKYFSTRTHTFNIS